MDANSTRAARCGPRRFRLLNSTKVILLYEINLGNGYKFSDRGVFMRHFFGRKACAQSRRVHIKTHVFFVQLGLFYSTCKCINVITRPRAAAKTKKNMLV